MEKSDILAPVESFEEIKKAARDAAIELVEVAELKRGDVFVVGC